ncbi:cell wall hydrolase [Bdellovibrio sp. HCB274]|uniref:cell wall hydrolase n=1 Tax=Bdellovibrio sp. HCB274 TaxID=3394361 RepID=UPI0039B39CEF
MRLLSFAIFTLGLSLISSAAVASVSSSLTCNKRQTATTCMICNCYHETRGENFDGMVAVNKVVLSRSEDDAFPDSVCGVVFDENQFSWTDDRAANNIRATEKDDKEALNLCRKAVSISVREGANDVLYYYNPSLASPGWARRMKKCGKVDNHVFLVPRTDTCPKKLGVAGKYTESTSGKKETPKSSKGGRR